MLLFDCAADHLDSPDAAPAELDFPGVAVRDGAFGSNVLFELGGVEEAAEAVENDRDSIVCQFQVRNSLLD